MAAVNTYDYHGLETVLFYQAQNGGLMAIVQEKGAQSYSPVEVTPTPTINGAAIRHMVAVAWSYPNNVSAVSDSGPWCLLIRPCRQTITYAVLYNDANGIVYGWHKSFMGVWTNDGYKSLSVFGAFTISMTSGMSICSYS